MNRLVTIGLPLYKRMEYLPHVLGIIAAQDYPTLELIVSDNGSNGEDLKRIVETHYKRPFRFRRNSATVSVATHFNQIIQEAAGDYTLLLADDDEISANYVSDLMACLTASPQASVALARQEIIDNQGTLIRKTEGDLPTLLSGPDFIRAMWPINRYRYECFATFLAKTSELQACGGYQDFTRGNHNDNALMIKLALNSHVAFSSKSCFRWRVDETSLGWSASIRDLAKASREFLAFLENEPAIQHFRRVQPAEWVELKSHLVEMTWQTYFGRWNNLYRKRLSWVEWTRAAFALPYIKPYYRRVASVLVNSGKSALKAQVRSLRPG